MDVSHSARAELDTSKRTTIEEAMILEETERVIRYTCLSNRTFELIVLPTEQCNFRCTYCYEDFSIGRMQEETIRGVCKLLERRIPSLESLKVGYFGGEPLLNMPAVRRISSLAQSLCATHDVVFTSGMTTNGYLLDAERLEELIAIGCNEFQISLDGWQESHDMTRLQRNSAGSFERIWANLLAAAQSDLAFNIILRVHMTPANASTLSVLIDNINEHLGDQRFTVLLKAVGNWGGSNSNHPDVFERGSEQLIDLYNKLMSAINRSTSYGVDETGGGALPSTINEQYGVSSGVEIPAMCYAGRSNSLVVRSNGRINKCTVALRNPKNDIGYIDDEGHLHIDSAKLTPWLIGVATLDKKQLGCPAATVLYGI